MQQQQQQMQMVQQAAENIAKQNLQLQQEALHAKRVNAPLPVEEIQMGENPPAPPKPPAPEPPAPAPPQPDPAILENVMNRIPQQAEPQKPPTQEDILAKINKRIPQQKPPKSMNQIHAKLLQKNIADLAPAQKQITFLSESVMDVQHFANFFKGQQYSGNIMKGFEFLLKYGTHPDISRLMDYYVSGASQGITSLSAALMDSGLTSHQRHRLMRHIINTSVGDLNELAVHLNPSFSLSGPNKVRETTRSYYDRALSSKFKELNEEYNLSIEDPSYLDRAVRDYGRVYKETQSRNIFHQGLYPAYLESEYAGNNILKDFSSRFVRNFISGKLLEEANEISSKYMNPKPPTTRKNNEFPIFGAVRSLFADSNNNYLSTPFSKDLLEENPRLYTNNSVAFAYAAAFGNIKRPENAAPAVLALSGANTMFRGSLFNLKPASKAKNQDDEFRAASTLRSYSPHPAMAMKYLQIKEEFSLSTPVTQKILGNENVFMEAAQEYVNRTSSFYANPPDINSVKQKQFKDLYGKMTVFDDLFNDLSETIDAVMTNTLYNTLKNLTEKTPSIEVEKITNEIKGYASQLSMYTQMGKSITRNYDLKIDPADQSYGQAGFYGDPSFYTDKFSQVHRALIQQQKEVIAKLKEKEAKSKKSKLPVPSFEGTIPQKAGEALLIATSHLYSSTMALFNIAVDRIAGKMFKLYSMGAASRLESGEAPLSGIENFKQLNEWMGQKKAGALKRPLSVVTNAPQAIVQQPPPQAPAVPNPLAEQEEQARKAAEEEKARKKAQKLEEKKKQQQEILKIIEEEEQFLENMRIQTEKEKAEALAKREAAKKAYEEKKKQQQQAAAPQPMEEEPPAPPPPPQEEQGPPPAPPLPQKPLPEGLPPRPEGPVPPIPEQPPPQQEPAPPQQEPAPPQQEPAPPQQEEEPQQQKPKKKTTGQMKKAQLIATYGKQYQYMEEEEEEPPQQKPKKKATGQMKKAQLIATYGKQYQYMEEEEEQRKKEKEERKKILQEEEEEEANNPFAPKKKKLSSLMRKSQLLSKYGNKYKYLAEEEDKKEEEEEDDEEIQKIIEKKKQIEEQKKKAKALEEEIAQAQQQEEPPAQAPPSGNEPVPLEPPSKKHAGGNLNFEEAPVMPPTGVQPQKPRMPSFLQRVAQAGLQVDVSHLFDHMPIENMSAKTRPQVEPPPVVNQPFIIPEDPGVSQMMGQQQAMEEDTNPQPGAPPPEEPPQALDPGNAVNVINQAAMEEDNTEPVPQAANVFSVPKKTVRLKSSGLMKLQQLTETYGKKYKYLGKQEEEEEDPAGKSKVAKPGTRTSARTTGKKKSK